MNSRTIWEQFGADFAVLRIAFNKGFSFKGFVVHQYRIQGVDNKAFAKSNKQMYSVLCCVRGQVNNSITCCEVYVVCETRLVPSQPLGCYTDWKMSRANTTYRAQHASEYPRPRGW